MSPSSPPGANGPALPGEPTVAGPTAGGPTAGGPTAGGPTAGGPAAGVPAAPGGPAAGVPAAPGGRGRAGQVAWALVPLLTIGTLAFVPFLRLALARRRPRDWLVFGSYLAADVAVVVLVSVTSVDSAANTLAGGLLVLLAGLGTVHTLVAFRPGARGPASLAARDGDPNRLAAERAEERMRLRREARNLHRDNPVLAGGTQDRQAGSAAQL